MLNTKQNRVDHRLFERFGADFPVSFKSCGAGSKNDVELHDVSAQGFSISANKYFVNNETVELEVDLQDDQPNMILEGSVVWSQANKPKGWHFGIKINQIKFMRMSRLYRALNLSPLDEA